MALNLPKNASEVVQRSKTDVQRQLPTSNPFFKNNWLSAIITSYANRVFDFYVQLSEAIVQALPDTATGIFLQRWAAIWGILKLPAVKSVGAVSATGTAGSIIPLASLYVSSEGDIYEATAAATVLATITPIASITRSGNTATVTTTADHDLGSNVQINIVGAIETDYNGIYLIQVTGANTFTYTVANSPTTPATGVITANYTFASVPVISQDTGLVTNQVLDAVLTLQSPIAGVDDTANVDFGALGGGSDQETDGAMRLRLLDRIQNPVALFNVAAIESQARTVPGVTRVFVQEITPAVGQVTIYFMRDGDLNPIPDPSEVATTKARILEIKPANTSDTNVIVSAPTPVNVPFTFTALSPNTQTMQNAVTQNLQQFFDESVSVGVDIDQDAYRAAIFNTVDTQTGDSVQTFTLSAPIGDVTINLGEIGVLATLVYP